MAGRDIGNVIEDPSLLTAVLGLHNQEWVNQLVARIFSNVSFQRSKQDPADGDPQGSLAAGLFLGDTEQGEDQRRGDH